MSIENRTQSENARTKLAELERQHEMTKQNATLAPRVRELTLRSLKGRMNRFVEEIARFESRKPAAED